MGPDAMILLFWRLSLSQLFHSPLSPSSLHFLPWGWCHLHIWGYWYFSQQSWFQLVLHPAQHFAWFTLSINIIAQSCPTLWIHGLHSPRNSPGQNTGVGSLSLLQRIFPTQESNPGLSHFRQILYQLSHKGRPQTIICSCDFIIIPGVWNCKNTFLMGQTWAENSEINRKGMFWCYVVVRLYVVFCQCSFLGCHILVWL